jgi:hypothetical protein
VTVVAVHAAPSIPLATDRMRLVEHARRVGHLTRVWTMALPRYSVVEGRTFADVMPLGVALSWAIDLDVLGRNGGDEVPPGALVGAAFPDGGSMARMRSAVFTDAPHAGKGGVLAAVFPDLDMDALYQWARPWWTPPVAPDVPTGARLRLVPPPRT